MKGVRTPRIPDMAMYLIGDVQGCDEALGRLLDLCAFSPSRDRLVVLGDLVNRGPDSVGVLRRLSALGASAQCLLGNHDLSLLAVAHGLRKPHRGDTIDDVLDSPERDQWIDWLRHCPLAIREPGLLMVHAGVLPQWDADTVIALAGEVEAQLRGADLRGFLAGMFGNEPAAWRDTLDGADRLRVIVNALTRLRFCDADGKMDFTAKEGLDAAPAGCMPWFDVPGRRAADVTIAFGHWAALGLLDRPNLIGLDSGCVWGRQLSAMRFGATSGERELIQVECGCMS